MGNIELAAKRKRRLGHIKLAVLGAVAVTGLTLVAATAPGLPGALMKVPSLRRAQRRYQIRNVYSRLVLDGYITFENRGGKKYARITEAGKHALALEQEKSNLKNQRKRRWDKRWRVIIFDIPERRRPTRDALRKTMREVGFAHLQDSVWVYPYDCEEFIALLKAELKIGGGALYMVVEEMERDKHLREHFKLT